MRLVHRRTGIRHVALLVAVLVVLIPPAVTQGDDGEDGRRARLRAALDAAEAAEEAGRYARAARRYEQLAREADHAGWLPELEFALRGCLGCYRALYRFTDFLEAARRLLEVDRTLGVPELTARTESDLGGVLVQLGELDEAQVHLQSAYEELTKLGAIGDAAHTLVTIAVAQAQAGRWSDALTTCDRCEALLGGGDPDGVRPYLHEVQASIHLELGVIELARPLLEDLVARAAQDDGAALAVALHGLGIALARSGAVGEGLEHLEDALILHEGQENALGCVQVLLSSAELEWEMRHYETALQAYTHALALSSELPMETVRARIGRAESLLDVDPPDPEKALAELRRADGAAQELGSLAVTMNVHRARARALLAMGRWAEASAEAEAALDLFGVLDSGLTDSEATLARESFGLVIEAALESALASGDSARVFHVLERSRARRLATALGDGGVISTAGFTEAQRDRERAARRAVVAAQSRHAAAMTDGDREALKQTGPAWTEARRAYRKVLETIEREVQRARIVQRTTVISLEAFQDTLDEGDAYVAFAFRRDRAGAQVVTPNAAVWRDLGETSELAAACDRLARHWSTDSDPTADALALSKRALRPLDLPPTTKRMWVCPDGPLVQAPLDLLLALDAELPAAARVTLVPSATVLGLLAADRKRSGTRLLALGAPDYRDQEGGYALRLLGGTTLGPLPEAEREVRSIARDGDVVWTGRNASETRLRSVLARRTRWRAVHFACHGALDAAVPALSGLVLAPTAKHDGFLSAAEILHLAMPADLVVLSACDSGRGRSLRGEGLVGLARAFMAAGAPRIVASLWPVDDAATAALMEQFHHELRTTGVGTRAALERARQAVRGEPGSRWHAPRFWAAWVLWGLDD